jgi:small subunit ribosomal protein S8
MVIDPIADMLVRIRNAQSVQKKSVVIPFSKFKGEVLRVMKEGGFVEDVIRRGRKTKRVAEIVLAYDVYGRGKITGAHRISKQSQRMYWKSAEMHPSRRGIAGTYIVSTSRGVMSSRVARQMSIGGEIVCEVW